ncbi:unnamed protein product [Ilex paraguariensis]|uniref:Glucose-1-phosphate adenylyltransferase/Bifunctional protein GlmU-like C-terminal hexapeptide domain-containing protein n=1 Tax=Ilex paraguariensis TaxID=185542 RepID=A0ABC8UN75_9AQUA
MKSHVQESLALFTTRLLSNSCSRYHCSSCSSDQNGSGFVSIKPEDDAGIVHQEFQKWNNGGGTFHKSACVDPTVHIEFGAVVHSESVLGANVHVGSGAIIGPAVTIGQSTRIGYNVVLSNCTIGDSCVFHNGVCIGQDGFGFFVDECGDMVKKPQVSGI